jgi:hypothetical protein
MERKKRSKTVKVIKPQSIPRSGETLSKPDESENKPEGYGGIPIRDLKKNLGCG